MKPESNKSSKNIHVFRVNRSVKAKEKQLDSKNNTSTINSRTSLSAETKRLICEDHNSNPKFTQEALAKKYGCKRTTVAKIIKSKDRWLSIASDAAIAKRFRQRGSRYPLVENALVLWLEKEQRNLSGITDHMLRCQARQYAQDFSVEGSSGSEDFKASSSWVANFKQRYLTPKLAKLESESPKLETSLFNESVPELIEIKDQRQDVYKNTVHKFTSVFSVGPPIAHVNTPTSGPTSNSSTADTSQQKDTMPENDQISVSSEESARNQAQDEAMVDYTDDFDEPDFNNQAVEATKLQSPPPSISSSSHISSSSSSNHVNKPESPPLPPLQAASPNNPKLSAKEHLEAALAFYTNQNESSTSMSANMIKLILQNDFV